MSSSPLIVCLKSTFNNKFLRFHSEDDDSHGLLQFSGDKIIDPHAQFEVENSKTFLGLVHLKSRFNNKYLVRWSPNHYWISASANEKNEDKRSWSCTLFRIYFTDNAGNNIRLMHVQLGHYTFLFSSGTIGSCLFAESEEIDNEESRDVFTYIDWGSLFDFPKKVAFKNNGKFLGPSTLDNFPGHLQLLYDDINDPKVAHEVFVIGDGTLCIKSDHYGMFWRRGEDNWIVADIEDPRGTTYAAAMFRPNVLDVNVVALLNMSNQLYCNIFTGGPFTSGVKIDTETVDDQSTPFEVIDLESV